MHRVHGAGQSISNSIFDSFRNLENLLLFIIIVFYRLLTYGTFARYPTMFATVVVDS